MFDFTKFKKQISEVDSWLAKEFVNIRTSRATPTFLDSIKVDSYGSQVPINQVASIAIEDAKTIRISPWDASHGKVIEKALTAANLGVSVMADEKGVRVIFPELTAERREQIVRVAKGKMEDARKSLRAHRDEVIKELQNKEKDGGIGEDDIFRLKGEVQKMVDEMNEKLEGYFAKKEKEIIN